MAHLFLYDGVCGLCQGAVQFVLRHDHTAQFQFAALQSQLAKDELQRHGVVQVQMNTFYVLKDYQTPKARLLDRSDGALFVVSTLGGGWRVAGWARVFPKVFRDGIYEVIQRNRYAWFGQTDQCMVPTAETRKRFLDVPAA